MYVVDVETLLLVNTFSLLERCGIHITFHAIVAELEFVEISMKLMDRELARVVQRINTDVLNVEDRLLENTTSEMATCIILIVSIDIRVPSAVALLPQIQ